MKENTENAIIEYFQNLPQEIEERLGGNWRKILQEQLQKNNVPEKYHSEIKSEVFSNIAGIQRQDEVCGAIRKMLPLDSKALSNLCEDLRNKVLVKISMGEESLNQKTTLPSESQTGVDIIKEEYPQKELRVEEKTVRGNQPESRAGVNILSEEIEENNNTEPSPGRNSLLQGVEHPEDSAKIEDAAKRGEDYNPISSKLGGSTVGTETKAPQYKNSDPYREPIK